MQKTSIKLVKILQKAGFKAYWAGGCVRDILLQKESSDYNQEPQDYDIVTDATPDQIEILISKTIPVGKEFGVILAIEKGHHFEIATFRSDSGYSDGRRPDAVTFTKPEEDAKRRDFTINGLFYDPIAKKAYDFIEGKKDLKARLIRFIGDPHERIEEDHLRIIRAIRFKNTLNFQYHPDTYKALKKHAYLANKVSGERIRAELNKILQNSNTIPALNDLEDTGVLKVIFPEIQKLKGIPQPHCYHEEGDVWKHTLAALKSLPDEAPLRLHWATLLHDIGKPDTFKMGEKRIRFDGHVEKGEELSEKILRRLRFPRKQMDNIIWLVKHHMMMKNLLEMPLGRQRHWCLHPLFPDLMALFKADIEGTQPSDYSLYHQIERLYQGTLKHIPKEPKRLLTGEDIMQMLNLKTSPEVGQILDELREKQLAKEIKTKKQALSWLKEKK